MSAIHASVNCLAIFINRSFLHTCECRITYLCTCVLHFEDSSLFAVSRGPDISASHRHESNRFPNRRHSSVKDIPMKYVSETNYSMAFLVLHHYLRAECKYFMISISRSCDQAMRVNSPMTNVMSDGMVGAYCVFEKLQEGLQLSSYGCTTCHSPMQCCIARVKPIWNDESISLKFKIR